MFNQDTQQFRSYGRTKGKALSPAQKLLMEDVFPKLDLGPRIYNKENPIAGFKEPIWLEIGFGGAEHLLWQAKENPNVTMIGVEPFLNGIAKAVRGAKIDGLDNLKLYKGDARDLLQLLPAQSIDRLFILFPDPWPKSKHHKRRLINSALIEQIHTVLKPGGVFRFASDIPHYVDWSLTRIHRHKGFAWPAQHMRDWRERAPDWPSTRYFEKALREGRSGHFFEFIRI